MSIHGFMDQNGQIQKYDYNDLENKPTIPAEVLIDDTLTEEGQAADAKAVGDAIANIDIPIDSTLTQQGTAADAKAVGDAINDIDPGLSTAAKEALLALLQHVAYVDEHGQDYYDDLEEALAGGTQYTITNNLTGCITSNSSTKIIEGRTYTATITASSGYTLTGATATATMGGQTVTGFYNNGTISIPNVTGDLVITVTAISSVASVSASFSTGTDTPIDISSYTPTATYIRSNDRVWTTAADSTCICIPVTVGRNYALSWSETDATVVGTFYNWGFSSSSTVNEQAVHKWGKSTPQDTPYVETGIADRGYLVIQCASGFMSSILSNGYLSVTELAGQIYTNDELDALRPYLTVTATLSDSTSFDVTDYTLSGTLEAGNSTITVSYGGKSDTVNVPCKINGWLYHFEQNLDSSASNDFGFTGSPFYSTGADGTGYSYWHKIDPEGTSQADTAAIIANGYTTPELSGDYTISYWGKSVQNKKGQGISAFEVTSASSNYSALSANAANVASGWSVAKANVNKSVKGLRLWWGGSFYQVRLVNVANSLGSAYNVTPPSSFDSTTWHHYALTRKNNVHMFFVDGQLIFTLSNNSPLQWACQLSLGGYFDTENSTHLGNNLFGNYYDDLFVAEYCKWDSAFDPTSIVY